MLLPHTALSRRIEPLIAQIGRFTGWLWMVLLAVIVGNVTLRYVVGEGYVQLEELQWHIYATGFLLGLAYALQTDSHIRVDVLHERWPARTQAWVELYGILLLLLPFIALVLVYGVPFAWSSYVMNEISQAPGGLPMRWIVKAMLPLGFALLLLATLARLSRIWVFLFLRADGAGETSTGGGAHDR
jgi:TRAP-type mannitol/chloroaromatic compound transport system permease small subunit